MERRTLVCSKLLYCFADVMGIPCDNTIHQKTQATHSFHLAVIISASEFSLFPEEQIPRQSIFGLVSVFKV
jgi:hypothetical protein